MAELRKSHPDLEVELIRGAGGVFDVVLDDRLLFSKKAEGRHPLPEDILPQLTG